MFISTYLISDTHMRLTNKQKWVLYGLVRYPSLYDRQLADKIGVNSSTIATLRNRLEDSSYFYPVWVPTFNKLGSELLVISYAKFRPSIEGPVRFECNELMMNKLDTIIHAVSKLSDMFFISVAKNFTEFREQKNALLKLNNKHQFLDESSLTHVYFPFSTSRIINYYDYTNPVKHLFELGPAEDEQEQDYTDHELAETKFTELEKKAFVGLLTYPELSDRALADKLKMAHNTVTYMRNKFERENLIKKLMILNLAKSGFGLMALNHTEIRTDLYDTTIVNEVIQSYNELNTPFIFGAVNDEAFVTINLYKNYNDYEMFQSLINQKLASENYLATNSTNLLFPMVGTDIIKDHTYVPLVERLLGLQ